MGSPMTVIVPMEAILQQEELHDDPRAWFSTAAQIAISSVMASYVGYRLNAPHGCAAELAGTARQVMTQLQRPELEIRRVELFVLRLSEILDQRLDAASMDLFGHHVLSDHAEVTFQQGWIALSWTQRENFCPYAMFDPLELRYVHS